MSEQTFLMSDGKSVRVSLPDGLTKDEVTSFVKGANLDKCYRVSAVNLSMLNAADFRALVSKDFASMTDQGLLYVNYLEVKWEPNVELARKRLELKGHPQVDMGSAALSTVLILAWNVAVAWGIWRALSGGQSLRSIAPKSHGTILSRGLKFGALGACVAPLMVGGVNWAMPLKEYVFRLALVVVGMFTMGVTVGFASWAIPAWRGSRDVRPE